MSYSKTIQSMVVVACGVLLISQAQAVPLNGPQTSLTPKTCKNYQVRAMGKKAKTERRARRYALRKWTRSASRRAGSLYSSWNLASRKSIQCGSPNREWSCYVKAHPCRKGASFKQ